MLNFHFTNYRNYHFHKTCIIFSLFRSFSWFVDFNLIQLTQSTKSIPFTLTIFQYVLLLFLIWHLLLAVGDFVVYILCFFFLICLFVNYLPDRHLHAFIFFCLAEIRFSSLTSYLNKQIDLRMMELNKSSNPKSPNQSHQHTRRTGKHERPPPLKITTQTLSNFNSYWSESGTSEWDCFSILVSSCCSTYIHLCAKTCFSLFVEMR